MLFLYSDDGQFKDNKIPHKMKYGLVSVFKGGPLIQVTITRKDKHRTATGWPQPLIEVDACNTGNK